jgi:hypothetical protein
MNGRKRLLTFGAATVLLGLASAASAETWSRGYLVDRLEPALFFGGPEKVTEDGRRSLAAGDPGADCPTGIAKSETAEMLRVPWRSEKEVRTLVEGTADAQAAQGVQGIALAERGYRPGINVYFSPYAAPDPGQVEVSGTVAEGFDLDKNPKTGGFVSPDGVQGIDNALYRAVGCLTTWRGGIAAGAHQVGFADDVRRVGKWVNTVIRISGSKDPMNDDDATLEIAWSPDGAIADAQGELASGYSFRMAHGARYTKVKAKIVNGVIETEVTPEFRTSGLAGEAPGTAELIIYQGRMKLTLTPEGNLKGLLGGYVKWTTPYLDSGFTFSPTTKDTQYKNSNLMAEYYAIRRNADAMPDPVTGRYTALSTAYRISAVPAFVVEPKTEIVAPPHLFPDRLRLRNLFLTTIATNTPMAFRKEDLADPRYSAVSERPKLTTASSLESK